VNTGRNKKNVSKKFYFSSLFMKIDHVSITNEAATGVAPIIVDKEGLLLC